MRGIRLAVCVAVAAAVFLAGRPLRAQDATATLRGVVADTAGTSVPYALVRILPVGTERFTDSRGAFALSGLSPGTYRVRVRQVGYEPFESSVSLRAEGAALRITLRPLAIRLDELTVAVAGPCATPGPPDSETAPALAAVFAQLTENARRFAVLADSYPFQYFMERTLSDQTEGGAVLPVATDTIEYQRSARVRYRPGEVIGWGTTPRGERARVLQLPSLPDLADSAFHANHCFVYGGVVDRDGRRFLRVSFQAAEALRTPDIDGDADLDPDSYELRTLATRLTHPGRAMPGIASASATIEMRELFPSVVVPGSVRGVVEPTVDVRSARRVSRYIETQRLLRVHFLGPFPADPTPSPPP